VSVVIVSAVHVDLYIVVSWAWCEGPKNRCGAEKERDWESSVKRRRRGFIINLLSLQAWLSRSAEGQQKHLVLIMCLCVCLLMSVYVCVHECDSPGFVVPSL